MRMIVSLERDRQDIIAILPTIYLLVPMFFANDLLVSNVPVPEKRYHTS